MTLDSFRIALRGVTANRLRSSLTVLGILIGVGAVIVLVAVGNGSAISVQQRIESLGTNTLLVNNRGRAGGGAQRTGTQTTLIQIDNGDIAALNDKTFAPDIVSASPIVPVNAATATFNGATTTIGQFVGSDANYLTASARKVDAGRALTVDDVTNHGRVVVLGRTTAANLFGSGTDALGQTIQINGVSFQVVGLQATKGSNGTQDLDDFAVAPYTAVQDTLTGATGGYPQVIVEARTAASENDAQAEIVTTLDSRHHLSATATSPFTVLNQGSLLQTSQDTTQTFTVLLGAVAAISLLVGGIGVMNIMLVTVTERTREIGIRKAIGAPRSAVLGQFITEAVVLTIIGGLAGIGAGLIGSHFKIVGVTPVIAGYSIPLAFGVAVAVGLFFGIYPANRAASLRPIDALRHE
ncbi:MAG: putative transport system permease protein [Acidimicrobiaceae bacterium]